MSKKKINHKAENQKENFESFKQKLIADNEQNYGAEVRGKYGNDAVDASNAKVAGMTEEEWKRAQVLGEQINETLKAALAVGNPAGETAQRACALHKEWLCMFWAEGMYSKEAHKLLADGYVADERFKAYYDKIADGCAEFLRDAIHIYCAS